MKKKIILLFLITHRICAQQLYFPKTTFTDSLKLDEGMCKLANQVIDLYKENDRISYLNNVFRYKIIAKQYLASVEDFNEYRRINYPFDTIKAKGFGFQFESFSRIMDLHKKSGNSFNDLFNSEFLKLYQPLPEIAKLAASGYFKRTKSEIKDPFFNLYDKIKTDSVTFSQAKSLCRSYASYITYSNLIPKASIIVNEIDRLNYSINDSLIITTHNGVQLSAIVAKRRDEEIAKPVILVFNIYNSSVDIALTKIAVSKGYIGVVVNLRGKNRSNDTILPFHYDSADAFDAIDWISKQKWCNGKVGMYGGSYLGFSQWAAVKNVHPALKTIVPQASLSPGLDFIMTNNIFSSNALQWIHYVTNSKYTDESDYNNSEHWSDVYNLWYKTGLPYNKLDSIEGRPNKLFQEYLKHPDYDLFWKKFIPRPKEFSKLNIPILSLSGYYDGDLPGAIDYFNQHYKYNKHNRHYIVLGPYTHQGIQNVPSPSLFGYSIDSIALMNFENLVFDWFDYILKDKTIPSLLKNRINIQVAGSNQWRHFNNINEINNDTLKFYMSNEKINEKYKMSSIKPKSKTYIVQNMDFKDRTETTEPDWNYMDTNIFIGDNICLSTLPLSENITLNGAIFGNFKLITNKKDFDFSIQLYEQLPNGTYLVLNDYYIARASYLKNKSKRQLLKSNNFEDLPFNTGSFTSRKLKKGSRIVLTLGIIKNSRTQINYGTGKDVSTESIKDAGEPLQIKWYNDSYIKIPVWRESKTTNRVKSSESKK